MNKNETLINESKEFFGNVLGIGDIDDKLVKKLNSKKKITELNIISNKRYSIGTCSGNTKKVSLKNLRKMKKKKVNFLIVDYDNIDEYINTFIKDSIYITCDYIYFVSKNKKIKKYYSRYNTKIKEIKCSDNKIYSIDVSEAKNNIFKEFIYSIVDSIDRLIDLITNLLLS